MLIKHVQSCDPAPRCRNTLKQQTMNAIPQPMNHNSQSGELLGIIPPWLKSYDLLCPAQTETFMWPLQLLYSHQLIWCCKGHTAYLCCTTSPDGSVIQSLDIIRPLPLNLPQISHPPFKICSCGGLYEERRGWSESLAWRNQQCKNTTALDWFV